MSFAEYEKAQKLGMKAFKAAIAKGEDEYLPVLDEILENVDIVGEINLGLVQIPLENVVGTSNAGRTYAFANNFLPILDFKTEFGSKWSSLCDSHIEEGIREPIRVFEYLNKYYVIEGNKRVSVLKYFEAVTVPAYVVRKIPKLTDDVQVKIYYEFMDFYKITGVNYIWFSQEGCFEKLLELTSSDVTKEWTDDQKMDFSSVYHNFSQALKAEGGDELPLTIGDALLIFIDIFGYSEVKQLVGNKLKEKIKLLWEEFEIESNGREVSLLMEPSKAGRKKLMDYFWSPTIKRVKVAFIFDKDPKESEWLYGHELGRLYLEEHCSDNIETYEVHGLKSEEEVIDAIEKFVAQGVDIIFTTSSQQVAASLKVAVNHPETVILNCSLNTSHKLIRTYYARLYEVKFLAGLIAGAMSENDKIGYLADYPIIGMPANINAFALGAKATNPRAKVYLEWTSVKGMSREKAVEYFKENEISYISDQVMIKPNAASRQFGLYQLDGDNTINIAMPVYQWGVFYEKLIDGIMVGTFKQEDQQLEDKAINYWWGLSAGVVDLICSNKVPHGTQRILELIKEHLIKNEFSPFGDYIKAQNGEVMNPDGRDIPPEDVMNMNWLVDNIIGEIPEFEDLKEEARAIVELKGVLLNE